MVAQSSKKSIKTPALVQDKTMKAFMDNTPWNILIAIDLSSKLPEINYDTVTGSRGMEFIETIRGNQDNLNVRA